MLEFKLNEDIEVTFIDQVEQAISDLELPDKLIVLQKAWDDELITDEVMGMVREWFGEYSAMLMFSDDDGRDTRVMILNTLIEGSITELERLAYEDLLYYIELWSGEGEGDESESK